MRLIDADEFFKDFTELEPYEHISHEYDIDAVEAVHGEWIKSDDVTVCSCCGCSLEYWTQAIFYNYCPNCGASMDGEVKDESV